MIGPIYALFVEKIGGNLLDAGITYAIFALTAGLVTLISGKFSDKVKENELIIVLGYLVMGIGFFLYLFVNSVMSLFAVQIVVGIGEAIYSPAFDAVYSKHSERKNFGKSWGMWEATNYLIAALATALGGIIASLAGFAPLFVIMSILCISSASYIFLIPRKVL
jgi:MFS family permease